MNNETCKREKKSKPVHFKKWTRRNVLKFLKKEKAVKLPLKIYHFFYSRNIKKEKENEQIVSSKKSYHSSVSTSIFLKDNKFGNSWVSLV